MRNERTSPDVASIAGRIYGMRWPVWIVWALVPANFKAVKSLAASALTQAGDRG